MSPSGSGPSCPSGCAPASVPLNIQLYCIDGDRVAERNGMGNRINTIMQTCFFALAGILPRDEAIALIKESIEKSYARKARGGGAQLRGGG